MFPPIQYILEIEAPRTHHLVCDAHQWEGHSHSHQPYGAGVRMARPLAGALIEDGHMVAAEAQLQVVEASHRVEEDTRPNYTAPAGDSRESAQGVVGIDWYTGSTHPLAPAQDLQAAEMACREQDHTAPHRSHDLGRCHVLFDVR